MKRTFMEEKKHGAAEPIPDVKVWATEISVARNRAVEPYIKTFAFSPENVTQESLGMLVGAFSVSDRSESSEYVVNVIASVVKKEYYANPARGAVESFESTLHRINLALSELVKNGRTSWMGSLHGAIAVIEKEHIHFSATGDGKILLFRSGTLSDIGDGLASEEASSHPLKTFLEISSGRLTPDDCVLLASPEPIELFSPKDLERHANRLLPEGKFVRFLDTAMINDLRAGAVVVLDAKEAERTKEVARQKKPKRKQAENPEQVNAWSGETFRKAAEERTKDILESYDPEEDIVVPEPTEIASPASQEIRIQGEIPGNADEHPMVTRIRWMLEDAGNSFRNRVSRSIRDTRRKSAEAFDSVSTAVTDAAESAKSVRARLQEERTILPKDAPELQGTISFPEKRPKRKPAPENDTATATRTDERHGNESRIAELLNKASREPLPTDAESASGPKDFFGKAVSVFSVIGTISRNFLTGYVSPATGKAYRFLCRLSVVVTWRTATLCAMIWRRFLALSPKRQLLTAAALAFLLTGIGLMTWKSAPAKKAEPAPVVATEAPAPDPFPPVGEKNASLATVTPLPATDRDIVTPIYLGDSLYVVTKTGVLDISRNLSYAMPLPGDIRLAAGMKDLGLIFLLTEQGELYSFAPTNRALVKNAITLPSGFRAASVGSYSTYLYFLEEGTGRIYRFPRADGGFGDGVLWTKSAMPSDPRSIAVSENIYGSGPSTLTAFSRGTSAGDFAQERPVTPLTITAVCADADLPDRFVILDAPAKRIILSDGKGSILSQSFNDSLVSATACAISRDGTTVAVAGGTGSSVVAIPR